jgi:hypothetical protein
VIQILEDMLRACMLDYGEQWMSYLPSSPIPAAIKCLLGWHRMKLSMVGNAKCRYTGDRPKMDMLVSQEKFVFKS